MKCRRPPVRFANERHRHTPYPPPANVSPWKSQRQTSASSPCSPQSPQRWAAYRNAMKTFCAPVLRAGDKGCAITCIHAEIGTAEIGDSALSYSERTRARSRICVPNLQLQNKRLTPRPTGHKQTANWEREKLVKAFIPPCNQPEPQVLLKIFRKPASALPQYGLLQENAPPYQSNELPPFLFARRAGAQIRRSAIGD